MLDANVGYVLYQCLNQFGEEPFNQSEITMTEEERKSQLIMLVNETDSLKKALAEKNTSIARGVYYDKELRWSCRECQYAKQCSILYDKQRTKDSEVSKSNSITSIANSLRLKPIAGYLHDTIIQSQATTRESYWVGGEWNRI